MPDMDFDTALARFLAAAQALINEYVAKNFPNTKPNVLEADPRGQKYVRIVSKTPGLEGGSAWCFIDKATGDILKSDSWKRPAKGARGNIYAENPIAGCTPYGAARYR